MNGRVTCAEPASPDPPVRGSRGRLLVRALCLATAITLLLPLPLPGDAVTMWFVPALSPFVAVNAALAARTVSTVAAVGLAVGVIALARGRWFCRWVCPTGLTADAVGHVARRCGRRCPRLPAVGSWLALITLGGACLGYTLLLWLDPLALFAGAFRARSPGPQPLAWCALLGLPTVWLISLLWPGLWCARLCPLGATQDLLARAAASVRSFTIRRSSPAAAPATVNRPHGAVRRRAVLGAALGVIWAAAVRRTRSAVAAPLRPPGARDELSFLGLCLRCGNCVRACPTQIIVPDLGDHGIAGWLAPVVVFHDNYCLEDCNRCLNACPSGALTRLTLEQKRHTPLGTPRVDMNVCLLGDDRDCGLCRNVCPFEAIQLVFSETEYTLTPVIDPDKCPGCGACEVACPTTPTKAIVVVPAAVRS